MNTDATSTEMSAELELRPAAPADLPSIAAVHLASRAGAGSAFPPGVHSDDETRAWVTGWDLTAYDVCVAVLDGRVVGTALLDRVLAGHPDGIGLWVFESNRPARDFYARHGFVSLERTDGSANEERAPDIKLVWPGADALACFRSMIDDVDLVLGDVLARRTALTRAVQAIKPSGERDAVREAEIVRRVAAVVPELGAERVARIVDVIITEALDPSRCAGADHAPDDRPRPARA